MLYSRPKVMGGKTGRKDRNCDKSKNLCKKIFFVKLLVLKNGLKGFMIK